MLNLCDVEFTLDQITIVKVNIDFIKFNERKHEYYNSSINIGTVLEEDYQDLCIIQQAWLTMAEHKDLIIFDGEYDYLMCGMDNGMKVCCRESPCLGDKRHEFPRTTYSNGLLRRNQAMWKWFADKSEESDLHPVSYTHLTLPTIYSV